MGRIRVLVVDDSLTVRRYLQEVLARDPGIEVVGEASSGKAAIALCERLRPDVVTLDIVLPDMSGIEVTEHLMAQQPVPILVVSAAENRGELYDTYQALAAGAVDVLEKPKGHESASWERQLVSTVKLVARIRVIRRAPARGRAPTPQSLAPLGSPGGYQVVAIGASTGGPAALVRILQGLPRSFPLPVLVVLHIGAPFALGFADWLSGQSSLPVRTARDGEPLPHDGQVLLAAPDRHLTLSKGVLRLSSEAERHSCRPSVDVLFESVARDRGARAVACLLTGMGRDGAQGLLAIRRAGGRTLAQDEATSVVYGMPREAALLGAAEQILPLERIAPTLLALAGRLP